MELWDQIKNEDWMMPTESQFISDWPYRLWDINKPYQTMGGSGAQGIGYNTPAALGAALANKEQWPADGRDGRRRRFQHGAGRAVDRGAPQDSRSSIWCTTTAPIIRKS